MSLKDVERENKDGTRIKPLYKDEQDVVDLASSIGDSGVCFYPAESDIAHRFLASLRNGAVMQRERPDFEDKEGSLLLEVMRVDDHPRPSKRDRSRERESEALRELEAIGLDIHPDARFMAAVSSGLPTDQDHNYLAYVDHFRSTVLKHAGKADAYRAERPDCDLGFIVLDESTAYFESTETPSLPGRGRPHFWFTDSAFAEVAAQSAANCFIWLTPYKMLRDVRTGVFPLPEMTIIDVALLTMEEHVVYDERRMVSAEL
ncbi:hypothetical protein FRIG_07205 [Frigoribacterium faeni]|uniref:hypothetical protein n=1 Tax=Frigoribacterium faeni TaxID=145483 RepID=UPI001FAD8156|nr:hypothetical protein [Frigoribacterium faeni]MCJ0700918.1 hypothetical protein [Frigoribacterium faeni]